MRRALAVAGLALLAVGCGSDAPPSPLDGPDATAQEALDACFVGDLDAGLRLVARRASRDDVDALTVRALCRWMAFAADSARADADAALADLGLAIRLAPDHPHETPLDHLYAYRAGLRRSADPGDTEAILADLDAAAREDPSAARHVLDRAFVHLARADTAAAVADFERVLLVDATDTASAGLARQALEEFEGVDLTTFYRDQETVIFESYPIR